VAYGRTVLWAVELLKSHLFWVRLRCTVTLY